MTSGWNAATGRCDPGRLGALLALALLAGCASTVQQRGLVTTANSALGTVAPGSSSDGLSASGGSDLAGPAGTSAEGARSASGVGIDQAPTAATTAGAPGSTGFDPGAGETVRSTALGPGITDDSVLVGIIDSKSVDQVMTSAGIVGGEQGSNAKKAQALIDYINAHGGVAGRKLKLEVYYVDSSSTNDQAQAACADFTQDHHVFAVLDYGQASGDTLPSCLSAHSGLYLGDNGDMFDSAKLRQYPALWPVGGFSIERMVPAYIDGLAAQGFFSPWDANLAAPAKAGVPKVGLLYFDEEFQRRHNRDFEAALARHGMKFFDEYGIRNDTNVYANIQNAVLKFASEGITHVVLNQELNAGMLGFFALDAGNQRYYPRYGVTSIDFPPILESNEPDHKVFRGMLGVGWLPISDVDKPAPLTALQRHCLDIFRKKGIEAASANEETIELVDCDLFFNFAQVADAVGPQLSVASFFAAVSRLGAEPSYAYTPFDFRLHRDGIGTVNYLQYFPDCDCVRYTKTGIRAG